MSTVVSVATSRPIGLDALFRPRSAAIIGASRSRESIGGQIFHNMQSQEFCGPVYPINPKGARELGIRLVGPNCLGVLNTDDAVRLHANFAHAWPPSGNISFCSQSGALGLAVLDFAQDIGLGLRHFVSIGNKADVSANDLLEYWEHDDATRVILLYVESFGTPRRFLEIARRVSRRKPIIALKSGRSEAGARAAGSHTRALAGADVAVDALLTQAGVVRATTLEELFDAARLLATQPLMRVDINPLIALPPEHGVVAVDARIPVGSS